MTESEKESLLSTLSLPSSWCKDMEACDSAGESVSYDDPSAVAWDLTGGVCRRFGWDRATELFPQLARYILNGRPTVRGPNAAIASMVALQEFNDHPDTTHDVLLARIRLIPIWTRGPLKAPPAVGVAGILQGDA